jgi:hypothetical protein
MPTAADPAAALPLTLDLEDFKVGFPLPSPSDSPSVSAASSAMRFHRRMRYCGAGRLLVRRPVWGTGGRAAPGVPRGGRRCARATAAAARARGGPASFPRCRRASWAVQALVQGARRPPQAGPSRPAPHLPVALNAGCELIDTPSCLTLLSGCLVGRR